MPRLLPAFAALFVVLSSVTLHVVGCIVTSQNYPALADPASSISQFVVSYCVALRLHPSM